MNFKRILPDPALLLLALAATGTGLFFIFDAGYPRSLGMDRGALPPEFTSQICFLVPAILGFIACSRISPEKWMKISPVLWIVTLILLALVPTKLGVEMNGAKRRGKLRRRRGVDRCCSPYAHVLPLTRYGAGNERDDDDPLHE